jgi:hypothetical protein
MQKGDWDIPDYELEAIVRCFLPDIREFFATEEGKKCLEKYRKEKELKSLQMDNMKIK